jgi:hypothetical protein
MNSDEPLALEDGACAGAKFNTTPYLQNAQAKQNNKRSFHLLATFMAQAHPPAAGGHPLPPCWQHHAFFSTDHPAIQFANPASQS